MASLRLGRLTILFLLLISGSCNRNNHNIVNAEQPSSNEQIKTVKIMSFNIQIFGVSKMAKPEVVSVLVDIVSQADIIAVQEVRSTGIEPVEQFMALLPNKYSYVIGPREGRSSSKEQFWIIYDAILFTVHEMESWEDPEDIFERNPFAVYFKSVNNFDFIIINNHIQPSAATKEINALPIVVEYYKNIWNDPDVLIVGDFNADGQYYDARNLGAVFAEDEYLIIITNEYDTTVAEGENAYDRFIITTSAREYYTGDHGVLRFDEVYDFSQYNILPKNVSDHYPIWVEFWLDKNIKEYGP